MSLRKQALSGIIWTYIQQFGNQLISFAMSVVLARLILPEEFGLIGMIGIFMGIGTALFTGGLTSSLIRTPVLSQDDYSTVFFFNFAGSIIIYILLFFGAPYIAEFYKQPALINVTRVYGLTFILAAFGTVQNTILIKELKFKKQAIISFPALVISSLVGLVMAYYHYGVWSLVASSIANSFFTSLFLWVSTDWYPAFIFNKNKFTQHFHYGYRLTLSGIMDILFTNIYQIVIGKYYSATMVGYYTRANTLMMLPVNNVSVALNTVVFPLFSKVQEDMVRFKNAYKQIMLIVLFIITPIIVMMILLAKPLIALLFTNKWLPMAPMFQIICFSGILYPIHTYNLLVLEVKGRSDLFLKLEIIKKILVTVILLISFFYGFYAILWGRLVSSILGLFINTFYAGQMLEYSMINQLKDISPIFLLSIFMGIIVYLVDNTMVNNTNILRLLIGSLCGSICYLTTAWLFKFQSFHFIKTLILKK